MEVSAAVLANLAFLEPNGLLQVQGAGWEYITAEHFPWVIPGFVAGIVEFGADEFGSTHVVRFTIQPDGQDPGSSGSTVVHGNRQRCAFVVPFSIVATEEAVCVGTLMDAHAQPLAELTVPIRHEPAPNPELPS